MGLMVDKFKWMFRLGILFMILIILFLTTSTAIHYTFEEIGTAADDMGVGTETRPFLLNIVTAFNIIFGVSALACVLGMFIVAFGTENIGGGFYQQ